MSDEKIKNSTICWTKNKLNYANVVDKKESITTMTNKIVVQFDLFLTQQCNSIYNLFSIVITTCALDC